MAVPPWLEPLLSTEFFSSCRVHGHAARGEELSGVRLDVSGVRLDVSGVQTYVINSTRVIFLNERPQPKSTSSGNNPAGSGGGNTHICELCCRSLLDPVLFCSLGCKVPSGDTPYTSASTFEDLNLSAELLKGLYVDMKFQKPSKIQAVSLPMILTPPYKNLIAQAHNGSGKTTCFVLGMLSRVDASVKAPQALCICPTRELAIQNMEVLQKMGKYTGIVAECAVPMDSANFLPIAKRSPITAQVVIGTPGTIKKWMSLRKLSVIFMKILVFDEADHMLAEDGFKDDSLRIMRDIERANTNCQVLLFSATFNDTVKNFVTRTIKDYNQLFVKKEELSLESIKQYKVSCPDELAKVMVIKDRIFEFGENMGQTMIFVRTRHSAKTLHKALVDFGYEVTTIQGALTQEERDKIVKEFKDGLTQVLISTDVLARGFDQQQVNLVINYDLPMKYGTQEPDYEVYLHRIGRAGRFGRKGAVFNLLCSGADHDLMAKIETHFKSPIKEVTPWNSEEEFKKALDAAGLL